MPLDTPNLDQHAALTRGVGCALLIDRTLLALTGPDRTSFLNAFCTNNIKSLTPGRGCEAFITSPQGKTLGHVFVFCEPNQLVIDTSPAQAESLIAHFRKYVISEDVEFSDESSKLGDLLVAGPSAPESLAQLIGASPPTELYAHAAATIAGVPVMIRRVAYAGPASYIVQAYMSELGAIEAALTTAGAVRCRNEAVEAARLEVGFPLFGIDITESNLPQEVGRGALAISFTKGCYLGQETVARIDALGHVNQQLVGLEFAADATPKPGMPLLAHDKEAGHITSTAWSPLLAAPLALGYVRRPFAKPSTALVSPVGPVEVAALPVTSR